MAGGAESRSRVYLNRTSLPFWAAHVLAIVTLLMAGPSWAGLAWTVAAYLAAMFFVTAGYHRYFSHRTYKTSRAFQFVLAWCAQITCQKGVLWWSANHRHHHKHSDTELDTHSAVRRGFWWSHLGWFLSDEFRTTDLDAVRDLARYPELRWLNRPVAMLVPGLSYALGCWLVAGVHGLAYGALVPLVLCWHGTYLINSLAHVVGRQRYSTGDDSRNSLGLALITLGEGWHNNHHHHQRSCRQGFRWWEIDLTYYVLWSLARLGVVWDLGNAPRHVIDGTPAPKRVALGAPAVGDARADAAAG